MTKSSVAEMSEWALGGRYSILVRQRRDHIELDELIGAIDATHGAERQHLLNRLCRLVFPHAFAEESVLWPALRRMLPDGEEQTLAIEQEHQQINELFTELEQLDPDSPRHRELFAAITDLLRRDVRDEEDELFAELRTVASDRRLRQMGWAWAAIRHTAPTRPHPVVARRPPGNALAALPLTVIDRTRDGLDRVAQLTSKTGNGNSSRPAELSAMLAKVAGRVERVGVLRRGERRSTHRSPGSAG